MAQGHDQNMLPFAEDVDGTRWQFVLTFSEQDFDMDVEHGMPCSKRARLYCKHCRATNSSRVGQNPYPHSDLTPGARWRKQLVTSNEEFMQRIVRTHPLTSGRYFNRFTKRNDLMHCCDHHGVGGVIIASVIWFLVHNDGVPSLGRTQKERLDLINTWLKEY